MEFCRLLRHNSFCLHIILSLCFISLNFKVSDSSSASVSSAESTVTPNLVDSNTTGANTTTNNTIFVKSESTTGDFSYLDLCPDNAPCENLGASCITCKLNYYCVYGKIGTAECTVKQNITCQGSRVFRRPYHCRYGYQLDAEQTFCNTAIMANLCLMKKAPPQTFIASCQVKEEELCLGNRTFHKKFPCNWTSGFKWSTALALSVTLGGFGIDRFYIGLWRSGIGKLFSFGGLGVWTIVDVILIAVGYVGPHDGSLYIYPWN